MIQKPFRGEQLNRTHPLAKGLVGCWLFNELTGETVFDLSGNSNSGTLENGVAWGSGGLEFNGIDGYVDCGDMPQTEGISALSVSVWVKGNDWTTGDWFNLVGKRIPGGQGPFYMRRHDNVGVHENKIEFGIRNSSDVHANVLCNNVLDITNWHHIVGTWDGTTVLIFVDGVQQTSTDSIGGVTDSTTESLKIGRARPDENFNGSIRSVKIYNQAKSAKEIAWLYREPYAMFEPSFNPAIYGAVFTKREILNLTSRIDQTLATTSRIDQTLALSSKMDIEVAA